MVIYLARHGQTTGDVEDRYGGAYEDHLTPLGRQQAARLAMGLVGLHIEAIISSPKIRALETATIVSSKLGLPFSTVDNFRERNGYGIMTGMVKEEAARQFPSEVRGLKSDVHFTVTGGEKYEAFKQRVTDELRACTQSGAGIVLIITHGGPIRLVFRDILKLGEIEVDDCAYAAIVTLDGGYRLLSMQGIRLHNDKDRRL